MLAQKKGFVQPFLEKKQKKERHADDLARYVSYFADCWTRAPPPAPRRPTSGHLGRLGVWRAAKASGFSGRPCSGAGQSDGLFAGDPAESRTLGNSMPISRPKFRLDRRKPLKSWRFWENACSRQAKMLRQSLSSH
jgi:hypothetical protein